MAVRYVLPLVQVTPRGVWGESLQPMFTTLDGWLGPDSDASPGDSAVPIEEVVLRCLAAYGPASVVDIQAWSGLTRLGGVVERLRPRLVSFSSDAGREVFDLPDAPRPDADSEAPVRLLPTYDNMLLAHADRRRWVPELLRTRVFTDGLNWGSLLVDGFVAGAWRIVDDDGVANLLVRPSIALAAAEHTSVTDTAERLVRFVRPGASSHRVTIEPPA